MSISIIIPTRNEEKTITEIINSVKSYINKDDEILVIDGNSMDDTVPLAIIAGAKVVSDNGLGKGSGIITGIKNAKGDILLFIDADLSHDPKDIPKLIEEINNGADMCLTSRSRGGSEELSGEDFEKFIRVTASAAITLIINWRFGTKISDSQNGYRAIRKNVAKSINLTENSFAIETEELFKILHSGYRVAEIPSHELKRKYGESNINLWKMWYRYVACVLRNII